MRDWSAVPLNAERFEPKAVPSIAEAIPRALKKLGLDEHWRHNQISSAWAEVVGPDIARHAQPTAFSQNRLMVGVSHSTWLRELTHLKPEIL